MIRHRDGHNPEAELSNPARAVNISLAQVFATIVRKRAEK
jgi:hypothetical protein